jgi:hypothetical protein
VKCISSYFVSSMRSERNELTTSAAYADENLLERAGRRGEEVISARLCPGYGGNSWQS